MSDHGGTGGPPPGWYPDPSGSGGRRWWDGADWTGDLQPDADVGAEPAPRRGRRIALGVAASLSLLAAAFLGGAVLGTVLADDRAAGALGAEAPEVVEVRVPPVADEPGGARMPDVRGLDEDTALEVLADAVPGGDPLVEHRPWAGPAGTVIEQRPAFGARDPVGIRLVVSQEARVPDLVGEPLDDARAELEALGSRLDVERRFEDGVDPDRVLELDPGPGSALPVTVRLVASERTASLFLATMSPVEGRCSAAEVDVDGQRYGDALDCAVGSSGSELAWLLGRSVERLEGTLGVRDDGPTDVDLVVAVVVDDEVVDELSVAYGSPAPLDVDVSGALRVSLLVARADEDAFGSSSLILGDVRVVGGASALERLRDGGS